MATAAFFIAAASLEFVFFKPVNELLSFDLADDGKLASEIPDGTTAHILAGGSGFENGNQAQVFQDQNGFCAFKAVILQARQARRTAWFYSVH